MKKSFCFLTLLFLFAVFVHAQDSTEVTVEGVANIGAGTDAAAAHDKAVEDALRRAVEQAVGTMVQSETATQNYQLLTDKIYSQSAGYVKSYKIVSENHDGNLLRVKVDAQVSSGDLSNDLASIGMLQRRMKFPRVMVMIAEQNVLNSNSWNSYATSNSQAESTIAAKLKEKGFNVVDTNSQRKQMNPQEAMAAWNGSDEAAGHEGQKLGAEIVIVGQASSNEAANHIAGSDLLSVS